MTLRSMTGYGSAVVHTDAGEFSADLKTVNNRFLDVAMRLPRELGFAEAALREVLRRRIRRGKAELSVRWTPPPGAPPLYEIDKALLAFYRAQVEEALGGSAVDAGALLALPGVVNAAAHPADEERIIAGLVAATQAAADRLDAARIAEGAHLVEDLLARADTLASESDAMEAVRDELFAEYATRLRERMAQIAQAAGVETDASRAEQEVLLFADRSDITEELVRFRGHLDALRGLCRNGGGDGAGKTLDFLTQELLREANTMGNKARWLEAARRVVTMKNEIEKIREQAQNLE